MSERTKNNIVFEKFKSGIEEKGMRISGIDPDGQIHVQRGDLDIKVSLENVTRNYEREQDEGIITSFIDQLATISMTSMGTWDQVKKQIYTTLIPLDALVGDPIYQPVTMKFGKVYVYFANNKLTRIDYSELERWQLTLEEVDKQASENADQLLTAAKVRYETMDGRKLGFIEYTDASIKTSLLFAPSFRRLVEPDFGFPFYAVMPVRDFCYIFSENDFEFFTNRIGRTIVEEYKKSGYPLTTEVLRFDENGADTVGEYPVG